MNSSAGGLCWLLLCSQAFAQGGETVPVPVEAAHERAAGVQKHAKSTPLREALRQLPSDAKEMDAPTYKLSPEERLRLREQLRQQTPPNTFK